MKKKKKNKGKELIYSKHTGKIINQPGAFGKPKIFRKKEDK